MPDGLAVLGIFFQVGAEENKFLASMLEDASHVKKAGASVALKKVVRLKDLLPEDTGSFFR